MTTEEFQATQSALGLSGKEFAQLLGVTPSAITRWKQGAEIPLYIEQSIERILADKIKTARIPLTTQEMTTLFLRLAQTGQTLESYIMGLITADLQAPKITPFPTGEITSARVAEDTSQPHTLAPTPPDTPPSPK